MFCKKSENDLINRTHKRALRVVHNNKGLLLNELLQIKEESHIHLKNIRLLMCEVFKSLHRTNPEFMWNLFKPKHLEKNLRKPTLLQLPSPKSKSKGTNTLLYRASTLWNSLPSHFVTAKSISIFKNLLNKWDVSKCICKICKT